MDSIPDYQIYGLYEPEESDLRYIGLTTMLLEHRLRGHVYSARRAQAESTEPRGKWIRSLLDRGLTPHIQLIERLVSADELSVRERYWIGFYRAAGARLINGNAGGTGAAPGSAGARAIGDKTGKTYTGFLDPQGNALTITNMKRFCAEHGLTRKSMMDVYTGQKLHHKGYGHERTAGQDPKNIRLWDGFIRPDGTQEPPFWGLTEFCKRHGLHKSRVYDLMSGKCQTYKGWRYEKPNEQPP